LGANTWKASGNVNSMGNSGTSDPHDTGTNMVKAFNDAGLPHYGCFAHFAVGYK